MKLANNQPNQFVRRGLNNHKSHSNSSIAEYYFFTINDIYAAGITI